MPIANFTPVGSIYEYRVQENLNDLSAVQLQWNEDAVLLSSYKEDKSEFENIGLTIKNEILKSIDELRQTKDELEQELAAFAGVVWDEFSDHATQSAMDIFNQIFDPLMQAITPLMDVVSNVGLPEVPILGNLQAVIQKIAKTGQLISKLPRDVRNAARQEMADKKKAEKELRKAQADADEAERKYKQINENMTWWDRQMDDFKASPFGKIVLEIVDIFMQVLEVLTMICQCAVYAALLMLLEKLKPLLQQLGDIIALISNALSVMKMLMFSQAQLIRFFYKMLEEKLSELWGLVQYVIGGGWSLPVNGLISAVHADMICCEFEMSSINMEIGRLQLDHKIENDVSNREMWQQRINSLTAAAEQNSGPNDLDPFAAQAAEYVKRELQKARVQLNRASIIELQDKYASDVLATDISAFKETAPNKYKLELEKRTAEDEYLKNSHDAIKKDIEETKKLTEETQKKAAEISAQTEALKKNIEELGGVGALPSGNKDVSTAVFAAKHRTGR